MLWRKVINGSPESLYAALRAGGGVAAEAVLLIHERVLLLILSDRSASLEQIPPLASAGPARHHSKGLSTSAAE